MVAAAVLALILAPRPAHAGCPAEPAYTLTAMGNTVAVCALGATYRCTSSTHFLRQDEATGEVVSIAATCPGCFNDECVPPGTYRYGLSSPFNCSGGAMRWGDPLLRRSDGDGRVVELYPRPHEPGPHGHHHDATLGHGHQHRGVDGLYGMRVRDGRQRPGQSPGGRLPCSGRRARLGDRPPSARPPSEMTGALAALGVTLLLEFPIVAVAYPGQRARLTAVAFVANTFPSVGEPKPQTDHVRVIADGAEVADHRGSSGTCERRAILNRR